MSLLHLIKEHAREHPGRAAIIWESGKLDYAGLAAEVERVADLLVRSGLRTLALVADNGPEWAVLDLAALEADLCLVPLPRFFSAGQVQHALRQAGVQAVVTDDAAAHRAWMGDAVESAFGVSRLIAGQELTWISARGDGAIVPPGVHKLTYTSGTTGEPKGVMLAWSHIRPVVESLVQAAVVDPHDRHLALMPLAVLLENIGGIYAPLWAGATCILTPLAQVGLRGSSTLDNDAMGRALVAHGASTAILTPQSLLALVEWIEAGNCVPASLRFAAVGGAPVSPRLLERAISAGVPVYEGYGLSECASVVCLNTYQNRRVRSVGRPLPHLRLRIAADGEVLVAGPGFAGYLGEPPAHGDWWPTGDLGWLDDDGFLRLYGRRRNTFSTAFGRNLAPEWVEQELTLEPAIAQAAIFGEARPWIAGVIVPAPGAATESVAVAVARANAGLPDYARVGHWITATEPFTPANGCLTGTGRLRREAIYTRYADHLQSLYTKEAVQE